MRITIVGAGFVGEATGRGLSKHKNAITFVDTDAKKVAALKADHLVAYIPDDYTQISSDVTMFCVPTPTVGHQVRLDALKGAVADFAVKLKDHARYHVVVIRSTVPPKTTRDVVLPLIEKISGKKAGRDFGLVMQPEYLREVTAAEDYERPWFILIGALDQKCGDIVAKIYHPFDVAIEQCSLEEAEFQKYVHNVFNAVKIAFYNELRIATNKMGWDANKIFLATAESCEGMWNPLYGTRDFGPFDGACLPKDTRGLLEWGDNNGFNFEILRTVIKENIKHESLLGKNQKSRVNYLQNIKV